jgi:DNA-binding transcriptional LysR family regulator
MASSSTAIELRHLRYFLAVVDELHFGRAAERVHMAQPPLSQAIRRLEDELGVRLFERTSRAVSVTEAGRVFAEEARQLLASFERAVAEARRAGGEGRLRLGCLPDLPIARVQRFLRGLQERDPRWQSEVTHLPSLEQVRRLRAGQLELGILDGVGEHDQIEVEPLFRGEPVVTLLPGGHRLAAKERLDPGDLGEERLVLFPRPANPYLHDHLLAAALEAPATASQASTRPAVRTGAT